VEFENKTDVVLFFYTKYSINVYTMFANNHKLTTYNKTEACENITFSHTAVAFKQLPQLIRCCAVTNIANKDFS